MYPEWKESDERIFCSPVSVCHVSIEIRVFYVSLWIAEPSAMV